MGSRNEERVPTAHIFELIKNKNADGNAGNQKKCKK